MANRKISELVALTSPDGSEELIVNDGGVSKKIAMSNLMVGIDDNATSTAITIDAAENTQFGASVPVNTLRYLDLYNTSTGSSAGALFRMVTSNAAGTGNTTTDIIKYKNSGFYINNNDTASSNFTGFGVAGSERMRIDSAGRVTMPYQPSASFTWSTHGFTGVFPATQITLNVGGHLASSGRFTAPIAGVYWVSGTWMNSTSGTSRVSVYKNGADMTHPGGVSYNEAAPYDRGQIMNTILLAANDYLELLAGTGYSGIHQYHGTVVFRLLG